MATYYVRTTGDDNNAGSDAAPWETLEHAAGAISSGDTVKIGDGTYTIASKVTIPQATINTTWESESADKTKVTVESAGSQVFELFKTSSTDKTTFKHLTVKQTSSSGTTYCFYGAQSGTGGIYMANVHIQDCDIHSKEYAIRYLGPHSKIERCRFTRTAGGSAGAIYALRLQQGGVEIDSCLFDGWYDTAIYLEATGMNVVIRNCTILGHATSQDDDWGIRTPTGASIYNTIVYSYDAAKLDYGIQFNSADATNTIKNCIVFGAYNNGEYNGTGAPTVSAQLEGQTEVTADGNPVFVDLAGGDYQPDTSGLAYQRGDNSSYPSKDLNGNSFNDPPSIGCYEAESSGGGGGGGAVVSSKAGFLSSPFTLNP